MYSTLTEKCTVYTMYYTVKSLGSKEFCCQKITFCELKNAFFTKQLLKNAKLT